MAYTKLDRVRPSPAGVWDSTRPYTALELVNSPDGWKAYLARKAVPAGTALTDTTYWTEVLDVSDVIAAAQSATADANAAAAFAEPIRTKADGIKCTMEGAVAAVSDASDDYLRGLRVFGKTTQDGTPSPGSPVELVNVGSGGNIGVKVCGKNLLDKSVNGSQYIGRYYVNIPEQDFKLTAHAERYCYRIEIASGETYSLSMNAPYNTWNVRFEDENMNAVGGFRQLVTNYTFTVTEQIKYIVFSIPTYEVDNYEYQLELGSTATTYKAYKPTQSLALSTPNGLPGIPVSSSGNYTDAEGQMWISDEIDLERRVYVQRIGHITSYASENISGAWMSSTGALTSGATVLYQLATPIETALSATEIAAYRALHSNYPNTTVYNDVGAHMAVSYNADTKTYIDNKFAALSAAIV